MAYKLLKSKIEKQQYVTKDDVQELLDVFAIGERITPEQYKELSDLLVIQ